MHSSRIRILLNTFVWVNCSLSFAEVGEFVVSEKLLKQIEIISSQSTPFYKRGRLIEPNINIRVSNQLIDSNEGGKLGLNVSLTGTSRAHSTTPVTRNRSVQAVVDSQVNANFQQQLDFTKQGLATSDISGNVQIRPGNISVNNNFRLLNGLVNRKALQQAPGQIASELPREKAELEQQVGREIQKSTGEAKKMFDSTMAALAPSVADKEKFPFQTKLSTKTGADGQLKLEVSDFGEPKSRKPKPDFENKGQLMASGVIHQDLLTQVMTSELAGKELKMSQLRKVLCSPKIQKFMDFCQLEISQDAEGLSVVFDKTKPIEFIFDAGRVTMKLNALYRTGVPKTNDENQVLLNSPGETNPQFETIPYQVEVKYKLDGGVAHLEKLSVTEKDPVAPTGLAAFGSLIGRGNHSGDSSKTNRSTAGALFNPVAKKKIQSEFEKLFAKEIGFHSASLPTKVKISDAGPRGKNTEILEAGSILPIEVKAENGWFASGSTFCSDANRAFGVTFSEGGAIQSLEAGSPAELTGFRVGDRIETFNEPEGRSLAFGSAPDAFIAFVKAKAANKASKDRKIQILGSDSKGNKFSRTVFLCPSTINHKQEAAKGISQFRQQ